MVKDIQHVADQFHMDKVITIDIQQLAIRRNTKPISASKGT